MAGTFVQKWDTNGLGTFSTSMTLAVSGASANNLLVAFISCVNANKSKLDGIGYVASIVEHNRLYVDNKCKHTRTMLEEYTWDDREGLLNERPKKGGPEGPSHMADAVRYAMYTHAYNQNPL